MICFKLIALCILITIGCKRNVLPGDALIIAKYIVFNEKISPGYTNCSNEVRPFLEMEGNDCSFTLESYEFDIREKYLLDRLGNLSQYWIFKPEGPLKYTINELQSNSLYYKTINVDQLNIKSITSRTHIIDSGDTLKIERVFQNERLVFVDRNKEMITKNLRMIYEYR